MALIDINTINEKIIAVVEAMYQLFPGNDYFSQFKNNVDSDGVDTFANWLSTTSDSFSDDLSLATTVTENFGITDPIAANLAIDFLLSQFQNSPNNRGKVILDSAVLFSGLTDDPIFGQAAKAFNESVQNSLIYSVDSHNPSVAAATEVTNIFKGHSYQVITNTLDYATALATSAAYESGPDS